MLLSTLLTRYSLLTIYLLTATPLQADCLVLGLANYSNHKLGSVSEEIIKESKVCASRYYIA